MLARKMSGTGLASLGCNWERQSPWLFQRPASKPLADAADPARSVTANELETQPLAERKRLNQAMHQPPVSAKVFHDTNLTPRRHARFPQRRLILFSLRLVQLARYHLLASKAQREDRLFPTIVKQGMAILTRSIAAVCRTPSQKGCPTFARTNLLDHSVEERLTPSLSRRADSENLSRR